MPPDAWLKNELEIIYPIRRPDSPAAGEGEDLNYLPADEGSLAVDLHEYPDAIVIVSPIAGVELENLDLSLHHDMLTIRGQRLNQQVESNGRVLHQECHWGKFSRSIILPQAVRAEAAAATLKNGILTIHLPKAAGNGTIPINRK